MSRHFKFAVLVRTPGEEDTEDGDVRDLAELMLALATTYCERFGMEVRMTEVERT